MADLEKLIRSTDDINEQLARYGGDLAIGAYGIGNRITFMFIMIVMGLTQGMQPIVGYNYGAKLYSRVKKVFYISCVWAVATTTLCFAVSEFIPGIAASLFTPDEQLCTLAANGLRIMNAGIAFVGFFFQRHMAVVGLVLGGNLV